MGIDFTPQAVSIGVLEVSSGSVFSTVLLTLLT